MKIIKNKKLIKSLLEQSEELRDNDFKLIANVWGILIIDNMGEVAYTACYPFLQLFAKGRLPSPESITRTRRKIQEKHKELRGKRSEMRKNEIQAAIIKDIKSHG